MAGIFSDKMVKKLKQTSATSGGNYITEGRHRLRCQSAQIKDDRNEQPMLVADFEVLATTSEDPQKAAGRNVNYIIKSANEAYFSNLKGLFLGLYGATEEEFNALDDDDALEILEKAFGQDQLLVGRTVIADAVTATAKKARPGQAEPGQYTRVRWLHDTAENAGDLGEPA
jgi:hypothetical protein